MDTRGQERSQEGRARGWRLVPLPSTCDAAPAPQAAARPLAACPTAPTCQPSPHLPDAQGPTLSGEASVPWVRRCQLQELLKPVVNAREGHLEELGPGPVGLQPGRTELTWGQTQAGPGGTV